ncbi:hypothetical protein EBS80_03255 [bacterium]|nr:hypothetical protein [bacterium]
MALNTSSRGYRAACYVFAAFVGLALLLTAFYAGMLMTNRESGEMPVDNGAEIIDVTPTEPEAVVPTTGDGIQVDWNMAAGETRDFNFYLRRVWETQFSEGAYQYSGSVLGVVRGGDYDGNYLVAETASWDPDSLGGGAMTFYVIEHPKDDLNPVVLTKYVMNEPAWDAYTRNADDNVLNVVDAVTNGLNTGLTADSSVIAGLNPADTVTGRDGTTFSFLGTGGRLTDAQTQAALAYPIRATLADGSHLREFNAYGDVRGTIGSLFLQTADGRLAFYDIDLPAEVIRTNPGITWNAGTNFPDGYMRSAIGGCGTIALTNVQYDLDASLLVQTGTVNGTKQAVYEYKDYHGTDDYSNWQFTHQENQPSYESFVATHPSFFLMDNLGRWIKFTGTTVIPPGECGKPVIYLYPTKTTDLSVTLAPQGGFTKSEPAYGNGWNVTASPNGSLVNKADGITYPYLFWEGRGGLYFAPTKYWVVAKADVHPFLVSTLAKLGLNAKETADFLEFWEPRMQAAPFYKIGFHGTNVMNQIAPLTVSQTPDTLVRVLMDYSELSAPIASNPPTLPAAPVRKGFTVIEWGGVIR